MKNDNFFFPLYIGSPDAPCTFIKKRTGVRLVFIFPITIKQKDSFGYLELINPKV